MDEYVSVFCAGFNLDDVLNKKGDAIIISGNRLDWEIQNLEHYEVFNIAEANDHCNKVGGYYSGCLVTFRLNQVQRELLDSSIYKAIHGENK